MIFLFSGNGWSGTEKRIGYPARNFPQVPGVVFLNRISAPSADRPATASNPGERVVAGAGVTAVSAADGVGNDAAGPVFPPLAGVAGTCVVVVDGENSYRNRVDGSREPPSPMALVIEIGNDPGDDAGVMTLIWLSSITVRSVPSFPPNVTLRAPVNPDPVMVTTVPPMVGPDEGEIVDSLGTGMS
jgi:hypothetical protein